MILERPSFVVRNSSQGVLERIEAAGRTCYKSEDRICSESASAFVSSIIARGHESVIEHESLSVKFVIDRGVSHELVRHRLCAFSQESTRYCDYQGGVTFIIPPWIKIPPGLYSRPSHFEKLRSTPGCTELTTRRWVEAMVTSAIHYQALRASGWTPQQARSVLPNSLKTEIVCTANLREWRHILRLRTAKAAHPQMREVMVPLLAVLKGSWPVIFDDLEVTE